MLSNENPMEKHVDVHVNEQKEVMDELRKEEISSDPTVTQQLEANSVVEENISVDIPNLEIQPHTQPIDEKIDLVVMKMDELKEILSQRNEYDKFRDESIQRMSKQIEAHELGLIRKIKETLLKDIIGFYDTIDSFQSKFQRTDDREKLNKDMEFLKDQIEEILYRNDVMIIETLDNKYYNREKQTVVKKELTDSETENNEIVRYFRQGFMIDDKIFRKQEVIIKEFKPTPFS